MAINVAKEVATLRHMTVSELCDRYNEVFGEDTNARNKQWLIKRIAWKVQANAEGDISERARRLAHQIAIETDIRTSLPRVNRPATTETLETASTMISPPPDTRVPLPGANIVKTYKGRSIQVRVRRDAFEFEGTNYKSLTAIARLVTGQKNINGFHFFGLRKSEANQ
ncbi:MAG TPA: DUF2924 domain-containing protein [Planctomycetaceae bacterium]|nr:DUF2924 domain-containing protein [Planctomycetaceae bacterium]